MSVFKKFDYEEVLSNISENQYIVESGKKGRIIFKTPSLENEECDVTIYLKFKKCYNDIIEEFSSIMDEKYPDLKDNFNKNIKSLEIKEEYYSFVEQTLKEHHKHITEATYDASNNLITLETNYSHINEKTLKSALMHELLHMASRKSPLFSGFRQEVMNKQGKHHYIGVMIDEGYTEMLNEKQFSKTDGETSYDTIFPLVEGIQRIVEKENMDKFYFEADLFSLIHYINFYEKDLDSVINLITTIDKAYEQHDDRKKYAMIDEARKKIADIYFNKIELQYKLGQITKDEFNKKAFLHVEAPIDFDSDFTDNAVIEETDNYYAIHDKDIKQVISKENVHSTFKPDIDSRNKIDEMFKSEEKPVKSDIK